MEGRGEGLRGQVARQMISRRLDLSRPPRSDKLGLPGALLGCFLFPFAHSRYRRLLRNYPAQEHSVRCTFRSEE